MTTRTPAEINQHYLDDFRHSAFELTNDLRYLHWDELTAGELSSMFDALTRLARTVANARAKVGGTLTRVKVEP